MRSRLASLFDLRNPFDSTIEIPLATLEQIIQPFLESKTCLAQFSNKPSANISPSEISKNWLEIAEWLRIGFEVERRDSKGNSYHALHHALCVIANKISEASPDQSEIQIDRNHLQILRETYFQLEAAASYLVLSAKHLTPAPALRFVPADNLRLGAQDLLLPDIYTPVHDGKPGKPLRLVGDFTNCIQFYNRPNDDYVTMAQCLGQIQKNLDQFFIRNDHIRPARPAEVEAYIPPRHP